MDGCACFTQENEICCVPQGDLPRAQVVSFGLFNVICVTLSLLVWRKSLLELPLQKWIWTEHAYSCSPEAISSSHLGRWYLYIMLCLFIEVGVQTEDWGLRSVDSFHSSVYLHILREEWEFHFVEFTHFWSEEGDSHFHGVHSHLFFRSFIKFNRIK